MSARAKNRLKSAWTPMNAGDTNNKKQPGAKKLYEERSSLVTKWFDRWTDDQRKNVFDELITKCKPKQLEYLRQVVDQRAPICHRDFTSVLPRVISLYIFSFLDPRSLCRSSQVCWYWKFLSELDVLWMAKCLKLGWYLTFTPSPYEGGMWKRNYIEHLKSLQVLQSRTPSIKQRMNNMSPRSGRKSQRDYDKKEIKTPWKGSDPVPTDTWRYNILDNNDVIEEITKHRKKKGFSPEIARLSQTTKSRVDTGNTLRSSSLSRMHITSPDGRPRWAEMSKKKPQTAPQYADVPRPGPVSPPPKTPRSPKRSPVRSNRDPPSSNLFPNKPWNVPDYDSDN